MLHSENSRAQAIKEQTDFLPNLTKSFQNGLIPVYTNEKGEMVVDAFKLWKKLQVGTRFDKWMERRVQEYDFQEGLEFWSNLTETPKKSKGGRPRTDYELSIGMAKELAMVERNENGRLVRRYFLEVEKQLRFILEKLSTPLNGVMPVFHNGKLGYPRKQFLISIGRSYKNGYRLRKRFPDDCFMIGNTACITSNLALLLQDEQSLKNRALQMKSNQLNLAL